MRSLIEEILRHWYAFRLRILIARDTTEIDHRDDSPPDIPDVTGG